MYPELNTTLREMKEYASKALSEKAKLMPGVDNLSIGEPDFGPPEELLPGILDAVLNQATFLDSVNRYESSRGSLELRVAIANWYNSHYGLNIDAESEILVTHGGVEAIAQSILSCTPSTGAIAVTNPSYMLYERSISTLGRKSLSLTRPTGGNEYEKLFSLEENRKLLTEADALIINSPENPTGYVLSDEDWSTLKTNADKFGLWIIHDEVYDAMSFGRKHYPAISREDLHDRTIMVNSMSKKFGIPGLRIGWMISNAGVIDLACKSHDYLYLGVNILFEKVATHLLSAPKIDEWLFRINNMLEERIENAMTRMTPALGYEWPRRPMGGMFLFPNVSKLYNALPEAYRKESIGESVASYLLSEKGVSTVPGIIYGDQCSDYIRLVLCTSDEVFVRSIEKLTAGNVP